MGKIDETKAEQRRGTRYPPPFDIPCRDREWTVLGDVTGLTQFGVNRVRLPPGVWSSQRHWHSHEDEFVFVISGVVVLLTDAGEITLRAGESAGFAAGIKDGHCMQNRSDADVILLVVGSRSDLDSGEYSDIDMKFNAGRYSGGGGFSKKDGSEI